MSHSLLTEASFFHDLLRIDEDVARQVRGGGCRHCGGPLDTANFMRKPRGQVAGLGDNFKVRFSFCCRVDGCRKRVTPASVRFSGRRTYLAVVLLLVAAVRQGLTGVSELDLRAAVGVDRQTIKRWLGWWQDHFQRSRFWVLGRARFMPPLDEQRLAAALTEAFQKGEGNFAAGVTKCLKFLAAGFC